MEEAGSAVVSAVDDGAFQAAAALADGSIIQRGIGRLGTGIVVRIVRIVRCVDFIQVFSAQMSQQLSEPKPLVLLSFGRLDISDVSFPPLSGRGRPELMMMVPRVSTGPSLDAVHFTLSFGASKKCRPQMSCRRRGTSRL